MKLVMNGVYAKGYWDLGTDSVTEDATEATDYDPNNATDRIDIEMCLKAGYMAVAGS